MNPRRVHQLMASNFPSFRAVEHEWVSLVTSSLPDQVVIEAYLAENIAGTPVLAEVNRKIGACLDLPAIASFVLPHVGKSEVRITTAATWKHVDYPNDGSHEHCLFSWQTNASYAPARSAYFSEQHGWITEQAYREFIEEDVYHLRGSHVV